MTGDSASKPMYEQIYEALRSEIVRGTYAAGDRVPSEKELSDAHGVSRITTKKALELLAGDGYIVRQPGRGSFVAESPPAKRPAAAQPGSGGAKPRRPRGGAKPLIGLVITDFADSYGTPMIYGMEEASRQHEAFLVIRRSFGIPDQEERQIQELLELGADGLIIFPAQGEYFNAEILKLVIDQYPIVLVDRYLKGISVSSICTDNSGAAKIAANHLFGLGHRAIGMLTPPPMDTTAIEDRIEGFIQAHAERGMVADRSQWLEDILSTLPGAHTEENREKDIARIMALLRAKPGLTALLATEYNIGRLALEAAGRLGKKVPEELSVLCFDSPGGAGDYELTHIRQNQEEMGRLALEHVLRMLRGETLPSRTMLPAELIPGLSTGPAAVLS